MQKAKMACVRLFAYLFLLSCIYSVKADECFVYNFENGVESFFGKEKSLCAGMSLWNVGNYSELGVESPNSNSYSFISPSSTLSCTSSFEFTIISGGEVEVIAYIESTTDKPNTLTVMAFMNVPEGNDAVVGTAMIGAFDPNFVSGWQTIRFGLAAVGTFQGYVTLLASAIDGVVLVDSIRYIPPTLKDSDCIIYEEEATTDRNDGIEDCVTYNFETDFEIRFTTDNYLCNGFLPWHLENYTSINIESPNPSSTVFMMPSEVSSCIASFKFNMAPDGIVEANIFMDSLTALDHIIVLAQRVTKREYDTVAGFKMYYPENQVFVSGWNVIRFSLLDLTSFEGYLIFIGSAEKGSTVLVDSVRYIPPLTPPDDASCDLY